jgi:lysophospholipase L1-like esterase
MRRRKETGPQPGDPVDVGPVTTSEALPTAAAWGMAAVVLVIAAATLLLANPGVLDGWFGGASGDANAAGTATDAPSVTTVESVGSSTSTTSAEPAQTEPGQTEPDQSAPFGSSEEAGHEMLIPAVPVVPEQFDIPSATLSDRRVEMVGDSLLLSARQEVREALDPIDSLDIDAVEGRPLAGGQSALRRIGDDDPDIVVIALGTNDLAPDDDYADLIEQSLELTSDAECVVWVDLQEFKPGLRRINRMIRAAHPSAIAPWSTIAGPSELHTSDGYHLSPEGQEAFADVIADTLLSECA